MASEVRDSPGESRFEVYVDGARAGLMTYRVSGDTFNALHTEVDDAYEGKGVGSALVRAVLEQVRDTGLRLNPTCPFVRAYVERHPEYADLVEAA